MNALSKTSVGSVQTAMPPQLRRAVDFFISKLDPPFFAGGNGYSIALADAPSAETRLAIEAHRDRIDECLLPAGPFVAAQEYKLLCTMGTQAADDEAASLEMFSFVDVTSELPRFALSEACSAYRGGRIGEGRWMPKPGEVRKEAQRLAAQLVRDRLEIEAVLAARVRPAETSDDRKRAALAAAVTLLKTMPGAGIRAEKIRQGRDPDELDQIEERKPDTLDELQAHMSALPPVALSNKIAAKFPGARRGLERAQEAA